MKNLILIALLIATACSKSEDPKPVVVKTTDASIKPYYDEFLSKAKVFNKTITKTVVLQFGTCDCEQDGVWYVDKKDVEFFTYHVLGHALLNRTESTETSIMNKMHVSIWKSKEQTYINELFK